MGYREFHYRWEYDLRASPEELWPLVADTNRFNRDAGVPAVELREGETAAEGVRRLRLYKFGVPVEWDEQPFEWVRPERFGTVRKYRKGPVEEARVLVQLTPLAEGGTRLVYEVWARPKNLLGLAAIPVEIGRKSARSFARIIREYDGVAVGGRPPLYKPSRAELAAGGKARLQAVCDKLLAEGARAEVVRELARMVEEADELTLARVRPYALADYYNWSRREVLETCLWATRLGMLDLQWDLICPVCRGAGESSQTLREVNSRVHCEGCRIDYTVNFDRSVELTFRPNPAIRRIEVETFCIGGPQVTPHIVAQQFLPPREVKELRLPLEAGRYRVRIPALADERAILVSDEGLTEATLSVGSEEGDASEELCLCSMPALRLENRTDREQLFVLERTAWGDQAATALEVTALQVFRDLFASEALRPGEQISVGSLTVLFTDLKNSTRLYREIGDATAFGRVLSHFDVLRESIGREDGALVKTIGDAVMAVFRRPSAALRAMLSAQERLAHPPEGMMPLMLKAGLHSGPCIAVTLNERLDYFGSTVNMAARLEGLSTGGDVVVSETVYADPEVAEMLHGPDASLKAEPFQVMLKGFDEESFPLWRVSRAATSDER